MRMDAMWLTSNGERILKSARRRTSAPPGTVTGPRLKIFSMNEMPDFPSVPFWKVAVWTDPHSHL